MTLFELSEQCKQLRDICVTLGEDPHDIPVRIFGEGGHIRRIVIEMPDQQISREWKQWKP